VSDQRPLTDEESAFVAKASDVFIAAIADHLADVPTWAIAQALTMMGVEQYVYLGLTPSQFGALSAHFWILFAESAVNGDLLRVLAPPTGAIH
jgi:hypothetical protein